RWTYARTSSRSVASCMNCCPAVPLFRGSRRPALALEPSGHEQRWQVSSNGGTFPRWSRDNKELFYMASDGELMSVPVKPGSEAIELASPRSLFALPAVFNGNYSYDVAPDGQRFLY